MQKSINAILIKCGVMILIQYAISDFAIAADPYIWTHPVSGVNAPAKLSENDVKELKLTGAQIVRLNFNVRPLIKKEPPYSVDEGSFEYLDKFLSWAEKYGLRVIIDPHTFPGFRRNTTTAPDDIFWSSPKYQEILVSFWGYVAQRYKDRGPVIAGYDLLNEPNVPRNPVGEPVLRGGSWNELVSRITAEIRRSDKVHTIVIEPIVSRMDGRKRIYPLDGYKYFVPPEDSNIVLSPHFYEPGEFTHQKILKWYKNIMLYPGNVNGERWDKNKLNEILDPIVEIQDKFNLPIFIGEFSAPISTGKSGNKYLKDLIELFTEKKWSWAYYTFRGANVWNAEREVDPDGRTPKGKETDRLILLRHFFLAYDK